MAEVYLGLGTNLGDKKENLHLAVCAIEKKIGKILSLSSFYATEPWGFESENSFLNAALCAETSLSPTEVLRAAQQIEKELGRTHKSVDKVYTDRLIDIDLLLYGDKKINNGELILPHPLMTKRLFVMQPLAEIAPDVIHPVLHQTIKQLLSLLL